MPIYQELLDETLDRVAVFLARMGRLLGQRPRPYREFGVGAVEFTQAIQYHRYHDVGPNLPSVPVDGVVYVSNGLPLVPAKETAVRVCVDRPVVDLDRRLYVTGELEILGRGRVLAPTTSVAPSDHGVHHRRGYWDLVFVLPSEVCSGTLDLVFHLWAVVYDASGSLVDDRRFRATRTAQVTFSGDPRSLPVLSVGVHYTGGGMNLKPPSPADIDTFLRSEVVPMLPSAGIHGFWHDSFECDLDLTVDANWTKLYDRAVRKRAAEGYPFIYVFMLPAGTPVSNVAGTGGSGVVVARMGHRNEVAHEIGHVLGLQHAPPGGSGTLNHSYPQYDGYARNSIGEFGFDVRNEAAHLPTTDTDFMQFQGGVWISPYTWLWCFDKIAEWNAACSAWAERPTAVLEERLSLEFTITSGRVERESAFTFSVHTASTPQGASVHTPVRVVLLDDGGVLLDARECRRPSCRLENIGAEGSFVEHLPWSEDVREIRIYDGVSLLAAWPVATDPPSLTDLRVLQEEGDQLRLSFRGDHPTDSVEYAVRYTVDGRQYRLVVPRTTDTEVVVDASSLPGGRHCCLEVAASAGLRTTRVSSAPFERSVRPRAASITRPCSGEIMTAGMRCRLEAVAHSPDFGRAPDEAVIWTLNGGAYLGTGHSISCRLSPGMHTVTVSAPDGVAGTCAQSVMIRVAEGRPERPNPDHERGWDRSSCETTTLSAPASNERRLASPSNMR